MTVHGRGTCLLWVVNTGICAWLHSNPQPVATEDGDAYPQDCITQRASLLENRNAGLIVGLAGCEGLRSISGYKFLFAANTEKKHKSKERGT